MTNNNKIVLQVVISFFILVIVILFQGHLNGIDYITFYNNFPTFIKFIIEELFKALLVIVLAYLAYKYTWNKNKELDRENWNKLFIEEMQENLEFLKDIPKLSRKNWFGILTPKDFDDLDKDDWRNKSFEPIDMHDSIITNMYDTLLNNGELRNIVSKNNRKKYIKIIKDNKNIISRLNERIGINNEVIKKNNKNGKVSEIDQLFYTGQIKMIYQEKDISIKELKKIIKSQKKAKIQNH